MERRVLDAVAKAAAIYGVPPHHLAAVVAVESGGHVFAKVDGQEEPLIRWEGHYFDRLVPKSLQDEARQSRLASPKAGAIKNPASQQDRWTNLLRPAMEVAANAALQSCSWGVGQVMGSHWKSLGYSSVEALVEGARSGVDGQIDLMMRFIVENHLLDELREGDWKGFAYAYNGSSYVKNQYDLKMRQAAAYYSKLFDPQAAPKEQRPVLKIGDRGPWVIDLQTRIGADPDGIFGQDTRNAVIDIQKERGLRVDGKVGPQTWASIMEVSDPSS